MNLNIKIRGNNKKEILKISMIIICINILISIITIIFANKEILKTVILYLISVVYIGTVIYIIKKENENVTSFKKENFQNKYNPILTRFLIQNEFVLDKELLNAEIYYLIQKGYVIIDKEKNALKLKDRNQFKQIDALERINSEKIKEYSTEEIPSYESMFIGKILFAFHDEIDLNEFQRNVKENYYYKRGEICKLAMEKMILYEIEKNKMLGQTSNINFISIASILNIITSLIVFVLIGRFNIVILLATIINIALNVIIVKNENILSYKYSDEVIKYLDDLFEYVDILKRKYSDSNAEKLKVRNLDGIDKEIKDDAKENVEEANMVNKSDVQLALLFGIKLLDDVIID